MAYICEDKESIQNAERIALGMMETWDKNNILEANRGKAWLCLSLISTDGQPS